MCKNIRNEYLNIIFITSMSSITQDLPNTYNLFKRYSGVIQSVQCESRCIKSPIISKVSKSYEVLDYDLGNKKIKFNPMPTAIAHCRL